MKEEVYRVAERYGSRAILVANSRMPTPTEDWIELVVVNDQFDAADGYIVDHLLPFFPLFASTDQWQNSGLPECILCSIY